MSTPDIITISTASVVVALALLVVLRGLLRREATPPGWLRYRVGLFLERDPKPNNVSPATLILPPDTSEAPTKIDWPKPK